MSVNWPRLFPPAESEALLIDYALFSDLVGRKSASGKFER